MADTLKNESRRRNFKLRTWSDDTYGFSTIQYFLDFNVYLATSQTVRLYLNTEEKNKENTVGNSGYQLIKVSVVETFIESPGSIMTLRKH